MKQIISSGNFLPQLIVSDRITNTLDFNVNFILNIAYILHTFER